MMQYPKSSLWGLYIFICNIYVYIYYVGLISFFLSPPSNNEDSIEVELLPRYTQILQINSVMTGDLTWGQPYLNDIHPLLNNAQNKLMGKCSKIPWNLTLLFVIVTKRKASTSTISITKISSIVAGHCSRNIQKFFVHSYGTYRDSSRLFIMHI